ncbi:MAG: PspC domain-containing protein [Candidatus Diapherotrites archaeon]|nr:PspC domain-containing protein [Candidatus Diapherotrites archaeon]
MSTTKKKRLYRSRKDRILGGVCGGIAEYMDTDPSLIRLLWVLVCLFWGLGIILYLAAWLIIPENPERK